MDCAGIVVVVVIVEGDCDGVVVAVVEVCCNVVVVLAVTFCWSHNLGGGGGWKNMVRVFRAADW